jgi:threonine aldolase
MKRLIQDDIHHDEEDEAVINLIQNEMGQVQRIHHLQMIKSLKNQNIDQLQKIQV